MIDLDELEQLEKAATPGPWETPPPDMAPSVHDVDGVGIVHSSFEMEEEDYGEEVGPRGRDALLIAALRNAAPELIVMAREGKGYREYFELLGVKDPTGVYEASGLCIRKETARAEKAEAQRDRMKKCLEELDTSGGLGHDKHKWIAQALKGGE